MRYNINILNNGRIVVINLENQEVYNIKNLSELVPLIKKCEKEKEEQND